MGRCRRHPHHLVVGVCAYCLNDHLSALLEKLEGYEAPTTNSPSQYMSPHAFTSSMPSYYPIDDTSSRASSSQFSLAFSPQAHRLNTHYHTTSSNLSPQNQVFFGNPDFIKGEIPRKNKSSFWSFLHRRKDSYFDACGTAHWHHDFGLEDVCDDHVYDDGGIVHMPSTSSQMRAQFERGRLDRHGLSKLSSLSMRDVQAGSSCKEKVHVSLPHAALSPKQDYHQRLSPSKQKYVHHSSSIPYTIRRSPLRHESHGDERDSSEELHGNHSSHAHNMGHYAHGSSQRHSEDRKNRLGNTSSWMSLLFPQKIKRSKSISGLSDVGSSGPPPHAASPDAETTRAGSVYFADQAYGSPSCIPMRVSRGRNVRKADNRKSLNMLMHAQGHSKSPKSSSFREYFGKGSSDAAASASYTNRAHSPTDFSSFEAYTHGSPPISSLFSKKRSEIVSIDCGKENRVSPIAMMAMKRQGSKSPHSPFSDEYVSPLHRNQISQQLHPHVDGSVPRCSPNFECLENSSTMLSDDEFRRSPMLAMKEHMQNPMLAPIKTKCVDGPDEHYGNQDSYSYSTRTWSTALRQTLAPMLGIGRAKKQGMKKQGSDPIHHVQHQSNACKQSPLHDDHDYIDLHLHHHHHHSNYQHGHGFIKAPGVHVKESLVLPGLDSKGPPQQYSFLSRDYSAFSFYFSPRQAYGSAEEESSRRPMQAGISEFGASKLNSLCSRAVDSIRGQNGRGRV